MAIFLDILGMLKSLYVFNHFSLLYSISMQHKIFVSLSSASSWREWATLCYFTMAELLIHMKREVCEQLKKKNLNVLICVFFKDSRRLISEIFMSTDLFIW